MAYIRLPFPDSPVIRGSCQRDSTYRKNMERIAPTVLKAKNKTEYSMGKVHKNRMEDIGYSLK